MLVKFRRYASLEEVFINPDSVAYLYVRGGSGSVIHTTAGHSIFVNGRPKWVIERLGLKVCDLNPDDVGQFGGRD